MHSRLIVVEAMALRREGLGARRIARRIGLPLGTVRDWFEGVYRGDLLRGLIDSGGYRSQNTGRRGWAWPRYGFSQASDDIRGIFCHAYDQLGVRWTKSGERTIYASRKADVAKLDEFIGPKC